MKATAKQLFAIENFRAVLEARVHAHYKKNYPSLPLPSITVDLGSKFAKIVKGRNDGTTSVHCFIEITSGDIYKAATWRAPAKHVRGNINSEDSGMSAVGIHGANYLK
jgi:hypothetical protein